MKYTFLIADLGTSGQGRDPAGKRYEVTFSQKDLIGKEGDVVYQPARWAALEAVKKSGKADGSVRVPSLTYTGNGRFSAEVAIL